MWHSRWTSVKPYIFTALSTFGFALKFCSWMQTIINNSMISILINGSQSGFLQISSGHVQGNLISPILFAIVEDVLSINFYKAKTQGRMRTMTSIKIMHGPTHLFFVDDIFLFMNGNNRRLRQLKGRVTHAKSIMNSLPIHNMAVYKWPRALIKEGDNILRNYIVTGDPAKRKGVMLKWEKGAKDWALFLISKFSTRSGDTIRYHKPSNIWSGIQTGAALTKPYNYWLIGYGMKIDF
ncbi:hypothetical protein GIB67_040391 [Kingdonia uniflora]|uniref:Reverse transcriptase domain-containing protein n=1 Tax=Kingdonia uniflora TaxID=39325 RepID=A0A7J7KXH6_9MAGN|nr:hypothetical protein GIB67_040391 [Kingdonia uniflora]